MAEAWRCGHPKDLAHSRLENGKLRRCKLCANRKKQERRHTAEGRVRYAAESRRYQHSPAGKAARARFRGSIKGQLRKQARIKFKGREIKFRKNPRTGYCGGCGIHYLQTPTKAQHALHHIRYDPANPLAFTVELCRRCHTFVHRSAWTKTVLIVFGQA